MDIEKLKSFVIAADNLNLTRAAETLFISQPALSKQISRFEDSLGCKLFFRDTHGLALTPAGRLLYSKAAKMMQEESSLLAELKAENNVQSAVIRIAYSNDFFFDILSCFIRNYLSFFPNQRFSIERFNLKELKNELKSGNVDLVFCITEGLYGIHGYEERMIFQSPKVIAMSPQHILARRKQISLADLRNERFLITRHVAEYVVPDFQLRCAKYGFEPEMECGYSVLQALFMDVALGHGIAPMMIELLPEYLVGIPSADLSPQEFVVAWNKRTETPGLLSVIDAAQSFSWRGNWHSSVNQSELTSQ